MSGTSQTPGGFWLFPHKCNYAPAASTRTGIAGDVNICAFYTPVKLNITRFDTQLVTVGGAGTKLRLGIYASASQTAPTPDGGALLWDSGDIAADSGSSKDIAISSGTPTTLTVSGWFFACLETADTTIQYNGTNSTAYVVAQGSEKIQGTFFNQTYGALPDPCPSTTIALAKNVLCGLRCTPG